MSAPWEPSPKQLNRLFEELGRCLFIYQSIEIRLKLMLPHMVVPGTDTHAKGEGFTNWRIYLDSKETMGPLMQRLKERMGVERQEEVDAVWTQIVNHRNEVVHHFASQAFARISSEAELTEAMIFLQNRKMLAVPMLEMLQQISTAFLAELQSPDATKESQYPQQL